MNKLLNVEPQVNVDGTPMVSGANVDIHGNPYGVTEPPFDSSCNMMNDSNNDSFGCGFDSSFDNSFDSSFDSDCDSFSSGFDDF
ncbi:hypothetical protein L2729_11765 [Shewanella gelidimarina]|uniref:hypothetical protein n=1 Tax=Shewanella gelidimarina TaxID=56813 RepID=UPI00200BD5AB|nr:hypothetical protein [Shewanella gelidimarina]MCL1058663.1 hypothetical protein [Shewanella gelidimarina]